MIKLEEKQGEVGFDMRRKVVYFCFTMFLLLAITGCSTSDDTSEDIFQYKDSLVGDNSAVGAIISQLPFEKYYQEFALKTKEEPYGILLKYDINAESPALNDENMKELALCNSAYLFTLVKNVEWVQYDFGNQKLKVNKKELQKWYGKELSSIPSEKDLKKLLQERLSDKNEITQYFEK